MSMEYIREYYGVPAKKGGKVMFDGKSGIITGTSGPHLKIRLDGEKTSGVYHPTYKMEYL